MAHQVKINHSSHPQQGESLGTTRPVFTSGAPESGELRYPSLYLTKALETTYLTSPFGNIKWSPPTNSPERYLKVCLVRFSDSKMLLSKIGFQHSSLWEIWGWEGREDLLRKVAALAKNKAIIEGQTPIWQFWLIFRWRRRQSWKLVPNDNLIKAYQSELTLWTKVWNCTPNPN